MKKNKKGFTLVELVIVVAVMAVLIAVAIPTVTSITQTAKETVAKTNAQTIESTLKLKEADMNKDGNINQKLQPKDIYDALTLAKLGIENTEFVYHPVAGTVEAFIPGAAENANPTVGDEDFKISFGTNNSVTVHYKENSTDKQYPAG